MQVWVTCCSRLFRVLEVLCSDVLPLLLLGGQSAWREKARERGVSKEWSFHVSDASRASLSGQHRAVNLAEEGRSNDC